MTATPKGFRLHIGVFGRRNAGKSTLVNLASGQTVSIVSPTPGTTADPVEKAMEFPPLGPVVWIDTAGLDDSGELGALRSEKARAVFDRTDLAVIVFCGQWGEDEQRLADEFAGRGVPAIAVANKTDLDPPGGTPPPSPSRYGVPDATPLVRMAAGRGEGLEDFRQAVLAAAPGERIGSPAILRDLVPPGSCVVLVTPIDREAPKGRLILPQVQAIRDALDGGCRVVVCKETELAAALSDLRTPPALVVTDSQAFKAVDAIVPGDVLLTGFSILYARAKGDLSVFARGAAAIDRLRDGDTVLVAESCTHHREDDDIGRVKLPALIRKRSGADVRFAFASGHDFPVDAELGKIALVLHCGACMTNRREVLSRLSRADAAGVPVVNYGMAIAHCLDLLERALGPFPEARKALELSN
ncbi:MAG: [FeFe] hydrogenase H-cluster maturation GTPase HydF [Planctomycetota bacterium]|jgi:[FeFe] hydrogenase H-cluster maturation GTPase HydF|nr:[FeFe] hydrogenase H-cluster maturation GTPase HydF [Planctomycetota bacterium]